MNYSFYSVPDDKGRLLMSLNGFVFVFERADMAEPENATFFRAADLNNDNRNIVSPMPGKVLKINISEGEEVKKGQVLLVVEAMKMENNVMSPADGKIEKLLVNEGDMVEGSALLVKLE
jgi:biotin carboxyl carrier protein